MRNAPRRNEAHLGLLLNRPDATGSGKREGKALKSETVLDGTVRYRLVHLTFGPGEQLGLDIGIFTPVQGGPFPAIILQAGTPPEGTALPRLAPGPNQGKGEDVLMLVGPGPVASTRAGGKGFEPVTAQSMASQRSDVFRRRYALVVFNPNDCAEDTTLRNPDRKLGIPQHAFFPAYPGYDWGILAGWAWGASRVADYLETNPGVILSTARIDPNLPQIAGDPLV